MQTTDPARRAASQVRSVQAHAAVVGVSQTWQVIAASENLAVLSGEPAESMIGQSFSQFFSEEVVHRIRSLAQVLSDHDPVVRHQGVTISDPDHVVDVIATLVGTDIFFEFEPAEIAPGLPTEVEQVLRLIRRVARKNALDQAAIEGARTVRAFSGYDRVSVHRLGKAGLTRALGSTGNPPLASDPGADLLQAHANGLWRHMHVIADTAADNVELHVADTSVDRIDGLCNLGPMDTLRDALDTAGIRAAMTIPILYKDNLWGAFLCHHTQPNLPTVAHRSALALFALLFGYELERLTERRATAASRQATVLLDEMLASVEETPNFSAALAQAATDIRTLVPHDGVIVWNQGHFSTTGLTVAEGEFERLFNYVQRRAADDVLLVDRLSDIGFSSAVLDADTTAMMAIPLGRSAQDLVLLFRQVRNDPQRVASWLEWEVLAGRALRGVLTEIQLRLAEDSREDNQNFVDRQSLLIAELNHRVRNILNLIVGLVKQGRQEATSLDRYADDLIARLQALSGAHDQLTETGWTWVSLSTILRRTLEAELNATPPRVMLSGKDVALSPAAYATMALVMHELTANARAHGALSEPSGSVEVAVWRRDDGWLELTWDEQGGPPVEESSQRRFGIELIRNAVPHELRGTAAVSFETGRLHATFAVPPTHLRDAMEDTPAEALRAQKEDPLNQINIDGAALVLEDSLIISLDTTDMLRTIGATDIHLCNSVEAALDRLDEGDVTFALLDVNLGPETSLAVAEQLYSDGIPAVLATGYSAQEKVLADFPPLPILTKPYTADDLRDVLREFRDEDEA